MLEKLDLIRSTKKMIISGCIQRSLMHIKTITEGQVSHFIEESKG